MKKQSQDETGVTDASAFAMEAPKQGQPSKKWLSKEELAELTKIKPWRWIFDLALNWFLMLAAIQLAIVAGKTLPLWGGILAYLVVFIFVGCLQNGMIQWRHEASHYNLTRNRKLNDILCDVFIAGPVGTTVGFYRYHHIPHHIYLNDPDREIQPSTWFCLRGQHLFLELFAGLTGFRFVKIAVDSAREAKEKTGLRRGDLPKFSKSALCSFLIFNALLFAVCLRQGAPWAYLFLWLIPPYTVAQVINNFRTVLEHQPSSDICDVGRSVKLPAMTRVIRANWLEAWLLAPVGFYYHYEHHSWPSIPYHRLKETRSLLKQKGFFEQEPMIYTDGYLRSLWKLAFEKGWGIRILNPLADPEKLMAGIHGDHAK